jgi:DNA mismatch repair protein MutS2
MDAHSIELLEFNRIKEILKTYAASELGRGVADKTAPLADSDKIAVCQEQTTELRNLLESRARPPLAGIFDITEAVAATATAGAPLEPKTLLDVGSTLTAAAQLKDLCSGLGPDYPRLTSLARHFDKFDELCKRIAKTVDERGLVRDNASPKLAEIRRKIELLKRDIREKAYSLTQSPRLRSALQDSNVTVRHGRYTISVKSELRHTIPGVVHDHSQTGQTVFVEPQELVALGNQLDDALFEERREVTRILWEITKIIADSRDAIISTVRALAWFDFTYAKARYSLAFKMSQPTLSSDGRLSLFEARHPLLLWLSNEREKEDPFDSVVPITVRLGEDFDLLVITGPNTGGKTVTLKTIGLLSLMAQSGLHIPAESSEIPVFRNVFIDVGDEQSIETSLSTFSSHMSRIVEILRRADARSLVLLDELGAGTDPAEGAALGTAILDHLLKTGARVAATTHLGSLKTYAYGNPRAENASVEFDRKTLTPTFRLLIGQPGSSNALAIAQRLGLPHEIASQAGKILDSEDPRPRELMNKLELAASEAQLQREHAAQLKKEAENLREQLRDELRQAKELRQRISHEADLEIHSALQHAKRRIDCALDELRQGPKAIADRAENLADQIDEEIQATPLGQKHRQFIKDLRQGDQVYFPRFDTIATVYAIDRKKETVRLKFGDASLETSFGEISWTK